MTELKHTRGPWSIGEPNHEYNPHGIHGPMYVICDMCPNGYEGEEYEANKTLIHAAPDLLEALMFIASDNLPTILSQEAQSKLEEAIKKATS